MKSLRNLFFSQTIAYEEDLIECIKEGDLASFKEIIEVRSINPKLLTKQGLTLMIYAAHYNKPQIIRYLHSIGCSIEQTGKNNDSALSRACYFKNYDSILELLNLGADINKKFDQYPLLISLLRGNSKLLEFLLEHGADYRILEDARNEGIMKTLPEELKIIIKRHKAFQARLGFLFFAKFSNGHICKLSQGILKEIAMFID